MAIKFSNFGKALIASAPSGITGLSFTVETGKGALFPDLGVGDYFYGIFKDASGNREIVKVSGRSGDSMTIASGGRGIDGTTARTWAAGDLFVAAITRATLEESLGNQNLSAIGNLVFEADSFPYFTGPAQVAQSPISAFARALLDDEDAATMRNTLGAAGQAFPAGTAMLFVNKLAPIGWTHSTSSWDHALRVVPGNGVGGTTGGSMNFTSAFKSHSTSGTVGATTLTTAQMPSHGHYFPLGTNDTTGYPTAADGVGPISAVKASTETTGGGSSHTHSFTGTSINLSVSYLNVIVATKD